MKKFQINDLITYLENIDEDSWQTEKVRTGNKNCVMGHIFDFGGGDNGGSDVWDYFEEVWATTYMIYPVNDGESSKYQQSSPKERSIAYIKDLRDGREKTTYDLMKEDMKRFTC